jgi:transcription antitermination factor NusG
MNERIRELAEQATTYIEPTYSSDDGWIFDKEKFAQLIVQDLIDSMIKRYGDDDELPIQEIKFFVKEHFGAESTLIKVGSRVKVVSGFNVGAKGTVSYIEPSGRMWVMRDGASTDVFYTPDEVVRIEG